MHVGNDTSPNTTLRSAAPPPYLNSIDDFNNPQVDTLGNKNGSSSTHNSMQDPNSNNNSDDTVLKIPSRSKRSKKSTKDQTRFYKYEVKQHKKMVRILTVIAYVICVSTAAIVLSLYYVFLWDPNMTKYRDIMERDCDLLIQKLKSDAQLLRIGSKDMKHKADRLKDDAETLAKCALRQNQSKALYESDIHNSKFAIYDANLSSESGEGGADGDEVDGNQTTLMIFGKYINIYIYIYIYIRNLCKK